MPLSSEPYTGVPGSIPDWSPGEIWAASRRIHAQVTFYSGTAGLSQRNNLTGWTTTDPQLLGAKISLDGWPVDPQLLIVGCQFWFRQPDEAVDTRQSTELTTAATPCVWLRAVTLVENWEPLVEFYEMVEEVMNSDFWSDVFAVSDSIHTTTINYVLRWV